MYQAIVEANYGEENIFTIRFPDHDIIVIPSMISRIIKVPMTEDGLKYVGAPNNLEDRMRATKDVCGRDVMWRDGNIIRNSNLLLTF